MLLIADASSKEELVGLTGECSITEVPAPQIINYDSCATSLFKWTEGSTRIRIQSIAVTIAEITDAVTKDSLGSLVNVSGVYGDKSKMTTTGALLSDRSGEVNGNYIGTVGSRGAF